MSNVYVLNLIDENDVLTRVQFGCMDNEFVFAALVYAEKSGVFHSFLSVPLEIAPGEYRSEAEMQRVESFIKHVRETMV